MFKFENPFAQKPGGPEGGEGDKVEKQENSIEDTADFSEAVASGRLQEAEDWLMANRERSDARWLDHRSRELFRAYRQEQNWVAAKRMVELGQDEGSKEGRRAKLAEEAGIPFDQI